MRPARFAASVFVAALLCAAPQDPGAKKPDSLQIRGTVIEFGTPNGIEEVDVMLERLADEGPRVVAPAIPKNIIGLTKTDTSGAFVFEIEKPGDYRVTIYKEGYNLPGASTQGFSANATVTPLRRLSCSGTVSYQNSRTTTFDNGSESVAPYAGDRWSLFANASCALDEATDEPTEVVVRLSVVNGEPNRPQEQSFPLAQEADSRGPPRPAGSRNQRALARRIALRRR